MAVVVEVVIVEVVSSLFFWGGGVTVSLGCQIYTLYFFKQMHIRFMVFGIEKTVKEAGIAIRCLFQNQTVSSSPLGSCRLSQVHAWG